MHCRVHLTEISATLCRFIRATGGNLTITFAFAAIPVLFALGATADYGFAVKTRAKLNAAADAAALAAVTPQMMAQSNAVAVLAARQMFLTQVSTVPRLSADFTNPANLFVDGGGGDKILNSQRVRTITVKYQAASVTAFSNMIHMSTIMITGTSTASASTSPNIDFYLMLDTSPSMAIPASQAGIDWMTSNTPHQGNGSGCAFACHENYPGNDNLGNPGGVDNYTLARNATLSDGSSIILRMDLVNQAVVNLVDTAQSTATSTGAAYQLAGYTFDTTVKTPIPLQLPTALTKQQASSGIKLLVVDSENSNNGDQNTVFDDGSGNHGTTNGAFPKITYDMSQANSGAGPGTGTNVAGDHPQQVLMIVSDGVSDQPWGGNRIYLPLGGRTNLGSRVNDWCTSVKSNPNVRIAVLYLVYIPLPALDGHNPSWYQQMIAPEQPDISPTMQNCASPGLFYQVNTGGDVSAAMSNLFRAAVKGTAHLTN